MLILLDVKELLLIEVSISILLLGSVVNGLNMYF